MRVIALAIVFALLGCGAEYEYPVSPKKPEVRPGPAQPIKKVVIAAFGAPWCGPCKEAMPEINKLIGELPKAKRDLIEFRLYVITGSTATSHPDDQTTTKYRDQYAPLAIAISDTGQKVFRAKAGGNAIPAAAVLGQDEKVMKAFTAGADFLPKEIVAFAANKAGL